MKDKCERLFEKVSVAQATDELHYHLVTVRDGMKSGEIQIGDVEYDDRLKTYKYIIYRTELDAYKEKKERERLRKEKKG